MDRIGLLIIQRIPDEHLNRVALVGAIAATVGVEVTAHLLS
jgi:hypothetical protein